ncbi:MAG TPA: cupin domain-containing protein, partial [Natronoarchaeum rubrum]|nr:cupin domain-containing protein [Natronoarchaeum rubrum]
WPYHYHTANEEALYVLDGTGRLRGADEELSLDAGDYVALPTGEDGAHRIINDSEESLRYLMISTMATPEVLVYPDSEKVGVLDGAAPGGTDERTLEGYYRQADAVDYWDGEE